MELIEMDEIKNAMIHAITADCRAISSVEMQAVNHALKGHYFSPPYRRCDAEYKTFALAMKACTGWILDHADTTVKELRGLMSELGFTFTREGDKERVKRFGKTCGRYSMVTGSKVRKLKLLQILQTESGYTLPDFLHETA